MGVGSKAVYQWFDQAGAQGIDGLLTIVPAVMKPFTFDLNKLGKLYSRFHFSV